MMLENRIGWLCLLACSSSIAGCGNANDESKLPNAPTVAAQEALVRGLPTAAKRTRFLRHVPEAAQPSKVEYPPFDRSGTAAEVAWKEQAAIIEANTKDSGWERDTPAGRTRVRLVDENSDEWEEEYEVAELQEVYKQGQARGVNTATYAAGETGDQQAAPPGIKPQGWSNGSDARAIEQINATYPADHNILRRMGQLNDGCTATLLGRRIVLTAAHCIVNANGSGTNGNLYRPRRDGATEPWGVEGNSAAYVDSDYAANNCHITYTPATRELCGNHDWAILRLRSAAWSGGAWAAMGYYVPGSSGWFVYNHGYPGCGYGWSPAGCVANTAYGQSVGHSFFNVRGPDAIGENTIFNSANDISPGHSGGPAFSPSYPDTAGGPYELGVITNEMCGTCNEAGIPANDKTYPAMSRRMTTTLAGLITDKRNLYP